MNNREMLALLAKTREVEVAVYHGGLNPQHGEKLKDWQHAHKLCEELVETLNKLRMGGYE